MRTRAVLFATILLGSVAASSAFASPCTKTLYNGVYSAYAFQDLGLVVSDGPVDQGGGTLTCGKLSGDVWTSTEISDKGPYGNRGTGDEIDGTVTYADQYKTPIGPVTVEASAAYWIVANFKHMDDDMGAVSLEVGRPISVGKAQVKPFVRASEWIGVAKIPNTTILRPGVRFTVPLSERWSVGGDVSKSFDLTNGRGYARSDIVLSRAFPGNWSANASVKLASGMQAVYGLGFSKTW